MPELWHRNIFPGTVFVSTDLPEKRVHVTKSKQELEDLDDDSTDIFKSNIIEHYSIRSDSISVVDKLCLAEFAAYYYKDYRKDSDETNDAQPNVLTDEIIHTHSILQDISLTSQITLTNTKEKLKCRKVKAVIRYHIPNKTKEPGRYFHHLLMLYNIALPWCRNTMKNLNCLKPEKLNPINLFVTGGAGAGKSHLIKAIYHTAVKTFRYGAINPERPTVALMAPTGVAAININGTTIHTALSIPKESGDLAPPTSDQQRRQLRLTLSELKLIIVDEMSMVPNTTLLHIHQHLKEIFNTPNSELFARISFIAVGDLYQLPPIRRRAVFENNKNDTFNLCHPWNAFKMIELTEIMRQKDDQPFTELLNRFRTGTQTEADIQCIQSRSVTHSGIPLTKISNYLHCLFLKRK